MTIKRYLRAVVVATGLASTVGCGGVGHPDMEKQVQSQNRDKVDLAKRLAEAVQKGDKQAALGYLEGFRSTPFDPAAAPKEADEIVQIYKSQIQPNAKGDLAAEIDVEMKPLLKGK